MISNESMVISKSRIYVAICIKTNFDGYYFRKFELPKEHINNAGVASYYFLNFVDRVACIEGVIPFEDYSNIKDVADINPFLL